MACDSSGVILKHTIHRIHTDSSQKQTMRFITFEFLLLAVSYGKDGNCDLKCKDSAPCVKGSADFSDHPTYLDDEPLHFHQDLNYNGMHCACSHGRTGILCDRIYVSCDGDHKCYNGGNVSLIT
jgi:hypothetical protein